MLRLAREITRKTSGALILAGVTLVFSLPGVLAAGGLFNNANNSTNSFDPNNAANAIKSDENTPQLRDAAPANDSQADNDNKPGKKHKKVAAKKESVASQKSIAAKKKPAAKKKSLAYDVIKEPKEQEVKEPAAAEEEKPKKVPTSNKPPMLTRAFAFTVGWVFGTPAAVVRRSHVEVVEASKDLLGDTDRWYFILPAASITVPFGLTSGIASGCGFAIKDAWRGSAEEKPFNKDLFSLGEMKD